MPGVFLNYRNIHRSYAPMFIDRELARRFGAGNVFQAGRTHHPGIHFPTSIQQHLDDCSVMVVLIDEPWLTVDRPRLAEPTDWVRREILHALTHDKKIIPVLLDGVEMPAARTLPAELGPLTKWIALRMAAATADADLMRLIGEVERHAPDLVLATLMDSELPAPTGPAELLRAEHQVLPWRSRPELEQLARWCLEPTRAPVGLVTGPASAGKTRLGLRLAARLRGLGWSAGLLSISAETASLDRLNETTSRCLVVIDRAETRPAQVRAALRSLAGASAGTSNGTSRVLLLSRADGGWLSRLGDDADDAVAAAIDRVEQIALEPLQPGEGDFVQACTLFARRLGKAPPPGPVRPPPSRTLLELQASALVAVLAPAGPTQPPIRRMLQLERHYWQRAAAAFALPERSRQRLDEVMTAVTLFGAATEPEADQLIRGLRAFDGEPVNAVDACRDLLRTLLPGPDPLNPVQPEPLAEYVVAELLASNYELADRLRSVTDEQVHTALLTLGRYLVRRPALTEPVVAFLAADAGRVLPLAMTVPAMLARPEPFVAAMSEALDLSPARELGQIVSALPHRSETLAHFAVVATERALQAWREDESPGRAPEVEGARLARLLATRLRYLGERPAEAVAAARSAVADLTALTALDPPSMELRAELAEAWAVLALTLDAGTSTPWTTSDAIVAAEAAIAGYRALPDEDRYQAGLVTALNNHAVRRRRTDPDEALTLVREAHGPAAVLDSRRPARYRSLLADVLDTLATLTAPPEAEALARSALALRRQLAAARPDAYRPQLAATLFNLGLILSTVDDQPSEVGRLWSESLAILDVLVAEQPGRYNDLRARVHARLGAAADD